MAGPSILVRIISDTKDYLKGVQDADKQNTSFTGSMAKLGAAIGAAFVAKKVVDFTKDSINAAKDLNANLSRTNTIFGDAAGQIEEWSKKSASGLRLSQSEALGAANALGKTLVGSFGLSEKAAADMTEGVVKLAKDMAVFNRIPFDEAMDKVTAGLAGQTRGLKSLGVVLDTTEIKRKAQVLGLLKEGDAMTPAIKAQGTYALMMEKTTLQQGATERASKSLGAQQERLSAEWKNAQATVGQALLPILTELATIFTSHIVPIMQVSSQVFQENSQWLLPLIAAFGAFVLAVKGVQMGMAAYHATVLAVKAVTIAWSAAQAVLNGVLFANPIGLIILGIVALVAAIVIVVKNIDTFKNAAKTAFDWIKSNWPLLAAIMIGPVGIAVLAIVKNFDTIRGGLDAVASWFAALPGRIVGALASGASTIYNWFSNLAHGIVNALMGIDLFAAGIRILSRLLDGMKSAAQPALDFAKSVADKISGLWPFSPAKWGPLRSRPPEKAGANIIKLLAEGMQREQRSVERVASRITDAFDVGGGVGAGRGATAAAGVPTAAAATRAGPAVVIENAVFHEEVDLELFMRKAGWAAVTQVL